jgi:hypothetical protein
MLIFGNAAHARSTKTNIPDAQTKPSRPRDKHKPATRRRQSDVQRDRALAARRGRGRAAAREAADAYGREPVDATQLSRRARISKLLGRT